MAAGHLVADRDLAALCDVDADQLVDARCQLVVLVAVEDLDGDDGAGLAVRDLEGGVTHLAGLLAEDRAQQALLRGQLRLALGRDLADEDVAVRDLRTDPDDAALVEVGQCVRGDVGDVAGDLLSTQLGVAGVDLVLLDVDRGEDVVLHHALREDDRVLEVVALPGHEGDEQVLAQRHLALVRGRSVAQHGAHLDAVALVDDDALVVGRAVVGATELLRLVHLLRAVVVHDGHVVGGHLRHDARVLGRDDVTGVDRGAVLHAGAHEGGLGADQRHGLALHVRTHEGAVRVVVLEERDERRRDGHHLTRGDVHEVDVCDRVQLCLTGSALRTGQDELLDEARGLVQRRVRLGDRVLELVVRREVDRLVGDDTVDHLAVRSLDEAERVDARVRRERADQTDVRTLGGLDGAHAAVVRRVDVTDLHAGAVAGQTARAQRGQAALVRQARQRVVLVHELRELAGAEELLDRSDHGTDVDERLRGDRLDVLRRHALAHDALHAGQARADLVLDELAHRADAAVAEVVDVVIRDAQVDRLAVAHARQRLAAVVQRDDVADGRDDVLRAEHGVGQRRVHPQLAVDLVATHLVQVVPLGVEVEVVEQRARGLGGRGLRRAQLAVDVQQRLVLRLDGVLRERLADRLVVAELLEDLRLAPAQGLEEDRDGLLALAVQADAHLVALVDLELQPRAPRRDDLRREDVLVGGAVRRRLEVRTGRADQLGDDDALRAVDDERALRGHEREVAHEHRLRLDLAGVVVHELRGDEQGRGVGHVPLLALVDRVLGGLEAVLAEGQGHRAGEVLDGRDLLEDLLQAGDRRDGLVAGLRGLDDAVLPPVIADQPVEAVRLEGEEVRDLQGLADLREGDALR